MISRRIQQDLAEILAFMPAVAILGPRQVGKTTLSRQLVTSSKKPSLYLDLERPEDAAALKDARSYLGAQPGKLVIIDEVQRAPQLFAVLRGLIDERRRHGEDNAHFILTGSASRELLRQSAESLAGRIAYRELTPFRLDEPTGLVQDALWLRGGMPLSALAPSPTASMTWRRAFVTTYLERDLPAAGLRTPAETLRRLWTMLAHQQGGLFNASALANSLELASKTIAHHVDILTDLMLVRRLLPWFANVGKRLVKSPKIYLRDSGILHSLLGVTTMEQLLAHPVVGVSWEGFVIEQLIAAAGPDASPYFYRTSAGAEIDLLLETPKGLWAIEIKRGATATPGKGFGFAVADLKPQRTILVHSGERAYRHGSLDYLPVAEAMAELVRTR